MPRIESNHVPIVDSQSEEHSEFNQKALWNAMYVLLAPWRVSDSGEDIFSDSFQSILSRITPATLTQFDTSTILLLLEICYSYLAKNGEQVLLGINVLDSIVSFVLNTDNHCNDCRFLWWTISVASFIDVYKRLIQSPVFSLLSSTSPPSELESVRPTIIHIYRKWG